MSEKYTIEPRIGETRLIDENGRPVAVFITPDHKSLARSFVAGQRAVEACRTAYKNLCDSIPEDGDANILSLLKIRDELDDFLASLALPDSTEGK